MSSATRLACLNWFLEAIQINRDTLGLTHHTQCRGLHGADLTFTVYEGGSTVSLYYFDQTTPAHVLRDMVRKNTSEDIATLFVSDDSLVPGNKEGEIVSISDDFILDQMLFTDGRIYCWNGDSIREIHYEPARGDNQYILMLGSVIDVSGLLVIDMSSVKDFQTQATVARFSYARFWEKKQPPKWNSKKGKGWQSASYVNEEPRSGDDRFSGDPDFHTSWEDFFESFRRAQQQQFNDAFFYGDKRRQQRPTQNRSTKPDPYLILGISPSATVDDIKRAYRSMVRQYHPDVSKDPDAHVKTKELNEAYTWIKTERGFK